MKKYYYGIDGDSIGRVIESFLITNQVEKVREFSKEMSLALESIRNEIIEDGGEIIFYGGDSILFYGIFEESYGEKILKKFNDLTGRTASMGIGENTANTYLGLKIAKSRGGNKAVNYESVNGKG